MSRRFCRCGATLVRAAPPDVDPEPPREPWYRRWLGGFRRGRGFWRRMRVANNGVRVRYDQARSAQVHLAEVTALLAALGITAVFVLPSTAQIEKQVVEQVTALDPRGYSAIAGRHRHDRPADPARAGLRPEVRGRRDDGPRLGGRLDAADGCRADVPATGRHGHAGPHAAGAGRRGPDRVQHRHAGVQPRPGDAGPAAARWT